MYTFYSIRPSHFIFDINECSPFAFQYTTVVVALFSMFARIWRLWFLYYATVERLGKAKDNVETTHLISASRTTSSDETVDGGTLAIDVHAHVKTDTDHHIGSIRVHTLLAQLGEDYDDGWFGRHRKCIRDSYLIGGVALISSMYLALIMVRAGATHLMHLNNVCEHPASFTFKRTLCET